LGGRSAAVGGSDPATARATIATVTSTPSAAPSPIEIVLATLPVFRGLSDEDRRRLAAVGTMRHFAKGARVFSEGDASDVYHTVVRGRVKIFKRTPAGKDVILTIVSGGDPLGAVAVYREIPYPATAETLEDSVVLSVPRSDFFRLLEENPSLARGLLASLSLRLTELTARIASLTGTRVESRFARLFLKLAADTGRPRAEGVFVPLRLSRQELADLTGTTIETCIRIMSRWSKENVVLTVEDGFVVAGERVLRELAEG
jgi:CRP/FNR family transcriptional regulator